ncbi:hypothetical protein GCM10023324_63240 [Streptomyces youssoufiensis]
MQRLLRNARWDADAVRDDLRAYAAEHLGTDGSVLVVDETGFLKKGRLSAGAQRQYTGTAGRIEDAQVGVFLALATSRGRALIDRRLYLPERSWSAEPERRNAAGIPRTVQFATKPRLAEEMIQPQSPVRAGTVAGRLPTTAWHRQSAGKGAKGPRYYDWAWVHIGTGSQQHRLIRRNPSTGELAFYLCWSPTAVSLSALVRVVGARWSVEECFQAAKGQVGLDRYQVRNWTAWHRHITLAMLALAFLPALAADAAPAGSAGSPTSLYARQPDHHKPTTAVTPHSRTASRTPAPPPPVRPRPPAPATAPPASRSPRRPWASWSGSGG